LPAVKFGSECPKRWLWQYGDPSTYNTHTIYRAIKLFRCADSLLWHAAFACMCRTYFKLKSFFAEKALTDAAWKTMIEWEAKIDKYGGYIEMDMLQVGAGTVAGCCSVV
jgi:hypothetical protein